MLDFPSAGYIAWAHSSWQYQSWSLESEVIQDKRTLF